MGPKIPKIEVTMPNFFVFFARFTRNVQNFNGRSFTCHIHNKSKKFGACRSVGQ